MPNVISNSSEEGICIFSNAYSNSAYSNSSASKYQYLASIYYIQQMVQLFNFKY